MSYAQFATGGTGLYQKQIYWLPWYFSNEGSVGLTKITSGSTTYTINNKPSKMVMAGTYEWTVSPTIRIIGTLSNVDANITTNKINSYDKSGLQRMYTGFDELQMALNIADRVATLTIKLDFQIRNNNNEWVSVDPKNHGIVIADSESMDQESYTKKNNQTEGREFFSCLASSASNWYIIDKPSLAAGSKSFSSNNNYKIVTSTENGYKKFKINNEGGASQEGATIVVYAKGANEFKDLTFEGRGYTHIMLGYFINHDPSNAQGYESAMHFQELLTPNATAGQGGSFIELSGTTWFREISNLSIPGAKLTTDAFFGKAPNVENPSADSSSNLDALVQGNLIKENTGSMSLVYNITYTNNYSVPAYIYASVDKNNNGIFESSETIVLNVPANSVNKSIDAVWTDFNKPAGEYVIRFRITTDLLTDVSGTTKDERAYGLARNGEVTDRLVKVLTEAEYNYALPVKLVEFTGAERLGKAFLTWKTNQEVDIVEYIVEKSIDGKQWISLGAVPAKNNMINDYAFEDDAFAQTSLYRLQIVEKDHSKNAFSKVVSIFGKSTPVSIYPNPTDGYIHIIGISKDANFKVYDMSGKIVKEGSYNGTNLDVSDLNQGNYIINIDNKHQFIIHRK